MEILREGEVVAGQVLFGDRGSLQLLWAGTSRGEFGQQSQGVFPALYYFGVLYAFETWLSRGGLLWQPAGAVGRHPPAEATVGRAVYDGWSRDTLFFRPTRLDPATSASSLDTR